MPGPRRDRSAADVDEVAVDVQLDAAVAGRGVERVLVDPVAGTPAVRAHPPGLDRGVGPAVVPGVPDLVGHGVGAGRELVGVVERVHRGRDVAVDPGGPAPAVQLLGPAGQEAQRRAPAVVSGEGEVLEVVPQCAALVDAQLLGAGDRAARLPAALAIRCRVVAAGCVRDAVGVRRARRLGADPQREHDPAAAGLLGHPAGGERGLVVAGHAGPAQVDADAPERRGRAPDVHLRLGGRAGGVEGVPGERAGRDPAGGLRRSGERHHAEHDGHRGGGCGERAGCAGHPEPAGEPCRRRHVIPRGVGATVRVTVAGCPVCRLPSTSRHIPRRAPHGKCRFACIPW